MKRWSKNCCWMLVGWALLMFAPAARAQTDAEKERARQYALQAGERLDQHEYAEALELVEQAEALYHAPTHLLFKGEALEGLGRLTEAIATYERLAAEPLPAASPGPFREAQRVANERIRALVARAPSLLIVVRNGVATETTASVDDEPVDVGSGVALRLDPGEHNVVVVSKGYHRYERQVSLQERGGVVKLEVVLEGIAPTGPPGDSQAAKEQQSDGSPASSSVSSSEVSERGLGTWGWVALGVGATGLVVGGVTGAMSYQQVKDIEERCPAGACGPTEQSNIDDAKMLGNVATAAFIVGAVGVAAGVVLYTLPRDTHEVGTAQAPWLVVGPTGVTGTF